MGDGELTKRVYMTEVEGTGVRVGHWSSGRTDWWSSLERVLEQGEIEGLLP